MMTFIQKSKMISLLKQYKRALAWFISGLVMAALLFLGTSNQQPATANASSQIHATASTVPDVTATYSDFGASHLEPNFYQYQDLRTSYGITNRRGAEDTEKSEFERYFA